MKLRIILLSLWGLLSFATLEAKIYDVTTYGAKGDGVTIDTKAINQAIDDAAQNGGGMVYFPAGNYASYSIHLQSHIHLYLEKGATLVAAFPTENDGYDAAEASISTKFQDFGHSHWQNSLIWGIDLEDITISGEGVIWGKGLTREESRVKGIGNKILSLKNCKNVDIKDITMLWGGHFCILASGVDNLNILNVTIDTNRDGIDIDCCKNVRISNCTVNSPWDDAIVLKASYALGYFRDTEDVTISDCFVSGFDRGTLYKGTFERLEPQAPDHAFTCGRIKLGTESSGGFKNIAITNCIFERCRGLAIESVDGGTLENLVVNNLTMRDIVNSPIFLRLGARQRSPEGTPLGVMRNIIISNISVYNADSRYSNIISGVPGACIENVSISNMNVYFQGGYTEEDGKIVPPEKEKSYPDPLMFGTIPAKGFYIRHAKDILLDNIRFFYEKPDGRELFVTDDVTDFEYRYIKVDGQKYNY